MTNKREKLLMAKIKLGFSVLNLVIVLIWLGVLWYAFSTL